MTLRRDISLLLFSVWRRNFEVSLVTWHTNLAAPLVETTLYVLAFGMGLGAYVGKMPYAGAQYSYIIFIAPGMISTTILFHAFFSCLYGTFVRMYFQKTFDAMLATPLTIEDIIAGELAWGATKGALAATLMLALLSVFGLVSYPTGLLVLPLAFLGGLLFAAFGMIFTSISPTIEVLDLPSFLVITPMFLFSGTFFPVDNLPAWARFLSGLSPLTHVVYIARGATLGVLRADMWPRAVALAVLAAGLSYLSLVLMKRRLIK